MAAKTILITIPEGTYWSNVGRLRASSGDFGLDWRRTAPDSERHDASTVDVERVSKRIAIVDDERDLTSVFSMIVRSLGHRTEFVAYDGNQIVTAILDGRAQPEIILMDYRMGSMNGIEAAQKVMESHPEIKIIIATADDKVKDEATSLGLFFIQKPFGIRDLAKIIDEAGNSEPHSRDAGTR